MHYVYIGYSSSAKQGNILIIYRKLINSFPLHSLTLFKISRVWIARGDMWSVWFGPEKKKNVGRETWESGAKLTSILRDMT